MPESCKCETCGWSKDADRPCARCARAEKLRQTGPAGDALMRVLDGDPVDCDVCGSEVPTMLYTDWNNLRSQHLPPSVPLCRFCARVPKPYVEGSANLAAIANELLSAVEELLLRR